MMKKVLVVGIVLCVMMWMGVRSVEAVENLVAGDGIAFTEVAGTSLTVAVSGDVTLSGTDPMLTIGDAGDEDTGIQIRGHSNSYYMQSDTTDDSLHIGVGLVAGTTTAIEIDSSLVVTMPGTLAVTGDVDISDQATANDIFYVEGTTPEIILGDGGNEDAQITLNGQTTHDFCIGTDNADDTLVICVGSAIGTENAITIDDGTATVITIGDADDEDLTIILDGGQQDYYIGVDDAGGTSDDIFAIGVGNAVGTTAILEIDTAGDSILAEALTMASGKILWLSATDGIRGGTNDIEWTDDSGDTWTDMS